MLYRIITQNKGTFEKETSHVYLAMTYFGLMGIDAEERMVQVKTEKGWEWLDDVA